MNNWSNKVKLINGRRMVSSDDEDGGQLLGPELIINGGFDVDANWVWGVGWAWNVNVASATAAPAGSLAEQNGGVVVGRQYRIVLTITARTLGGVQIHIGTTLGAQRALPGTYSQDLFCTVSTDFSMCAYAASNTLSIDNVSVRQVL